MTAGISTVSAAFPAAGLEVDRPTSGLPIPAFYSATDTGVVYRSADGGTSWAVWALALPEGTTDGDVPVWDDTAGLWVPGTGGGGSGLKDYATAARVAGNIAFNQSNVTDVDTGLDLTLTAAAGDLIEYGVDALLDATAQAVCFDVYTRVTSANVNPFGPGLSNGLATVLGVPSWYTPFVSGANMPLRGTAMRTLLSGDIDSGNVLLRLRYAKVNTTSRSGFATASIPFRVWAKNYGPA